VTAKIGGGEPPPIYQGLSPVRTRLLLNLIANINHRPSSTNLVRNARDTWRRLLQKKNKKKHLRRKAPNQRSFRKERVLRAESELFKRFKLVLNSYR